MAGTHIAINSTYDPLSMEEMLKMPMLATEAQLQSEEAYAKLAQDAADLESLANSAKDQATYVKYKQYANEVQKQLNELSGKGLNPNSRRSLYDLSARYKSEIDPIKQKMKTREDLIAEQRKARATNNKILYDIDYANMSLDDMMKQSTHSYNSLDGSKIYEEGKNQAAALTSRMLSDSQRQALQGQYFELTQRQGLDHTAAMNFMINNNSVPELAALKNSLMSQYDLSGYGKDAQKQVENFLSQGILEGITYDEKKQYQQNGYYMSRADQTRYDIDQQTLKIREIEAKIAQNKLDYYLKYGKFADEEEALRNSKGKDWQSAETQINNFGKTTSPYLVQYDGKSDYNVEEFIPEKKKNFDHAGGLWKNWFSGEDTGFNESVDGYWRELVSQEWMASPEKIAENIQKGKIIPRTIHQIPQTAREAILAQIMPESNFSEVLDQDLQQILAENVLIFEDRTKAGGGDNPQYIAIPKSSFDQYLPKIEEQTPSQTPKEQTPATKPAAKNWGPRDPKAHPSNLEEAADMQ